MKEVVNISTHSDLKESSSTPTGVDVYIPVELVNYVLTETKVCGRYTTTRKKGNKTHPMMRVLGFYLLLKAEAPNSGWILNYSKQIPTLSRNFGISARSFFTYMNRLEKMNLAERQGNKIRVVSWDNLGKALDINTNRKTKIKFNYDSKQQIHWWFAALDVQENQSLQSYMIQKKLNKNSEAKNDLISAMVKRGFDLERADDPQYFAARLFSLYLEDFRTGTEVHDLLINIRSDVNRSVDKLAKDWCISPQLTSYWKKRMHGQGIIDVSKIQVVSQWSRETNDCHKNRYCHVIWNDKLKERVWFLCDQISVLMPWQWEEFLQKNLAAA